MVNTDNWKLKNIFEDKNPNVFKIPIYQRGYDWESKHVEAFFDDLVEADTTNGGSTGTHFFGLIYLASHNILHDKIKWMKIMMLK